MEHLRQVVVIPQLDHTRAPPIVSLAQRDEQLARGLHQVSLVILGDHQHDRYLAIRDMRDNRTRLVHSIKQN